MAVVILHPNKMKRLSYLYIIAWMFFSSIGFAQNSSFKNDSSINNKALWGIFFSGDYSDKQTKFYNKEVIYTVHPDEGCNTGSAFSYNRKFEKPIFGWNFGFRGVKKISNRFEYSFGLYLDKQGFRTGTLDTLIRHISNSASIVIIQDTVFNSYQYTYYNYYLALPIGLKYQFIKNKHLSSYLSLEASINTSIYREGCFFDVSNKQEIEFPGNVKYENKNLFVDGSITYGANLFILYSSISIETRLKLNKRIIAFEPFFRYALTPNYDDGGNHVRFYQAGLSFIYYLPVSKIQIIKSPD